MSETEARKLAEKINKSGTCEVASYNLYSMSCVELAVHDKIDGGTFMVRSEQEWDDRVRESELYR